MIKKLKIKMILLSMISLFILLFVVVLGMNVINYHSLTQDADELLLIFSEEKGKHPKSNKNPYENNEFLEWREFPKESDKDFDNLDSPLPSTVHDKNRYFSVTFDQKGNVIHIDANRIENINDENAAEYGEYVLKNGKKSGFVSNFRYLIMSGITSGHTRIIFLDCEQKLHSAKQFLISGILMSLIGFLMMSLIIVFFAGRIVKPIAESYEKQKRFITDAGHEIKTPLTVIHANADLLEMELPENECLLDIKQQANRLSALTNDLVLLSRMEEKEGSLEKIPFPVSDVVAEAASPFRVLAEAQKKNLRLSVEPMLTLEGSGKGMEKLVSLLMDNALKYSPEGGNITLSLEKQNRSIYLNVVNTTENAFSKDELSHLFDRFYRSDLSRNSETGGYGIGLSIAKAIVLAHEGTIRAFSPQNGLFQITAVFPQK